MINQQMFDFIKQQSQQGESKEQIKSSLMVSGWQAQDIEEAFSSISNPVSLPAPAPAPAPTPAISSLPGAVAILGQAWAIYTKRLGTFLGVMAIPLLITIALVVILFSGGLLSAILLSSKFTAGGIGLLVFLAILSFVVIFLSQTWGETALLYAIKDNQEKISIIESYRRGWRKIVPYWWVSFLMGFIILGGFLLFIVPGIIFTVQFSLAAFILIAEDLGGMKALLKSREYVKGKWGGVGWRFFFIGALSYIIALIPNLIFGLLKIPFGSEISGFIIIGLFLAPLATTYSFLVYSHLKALKGE